MLVAFVLVERRAAEPIIPLPLIANPIVRISLLAVTLTSIAMFGSVLFVPLFIQGVMGTSATESGIVLMPMTLAMVLGSTASGQLISRTGRYRPMAIVGMVGMLVGMLLLSLLGTAATSGELLRDVTILGLGLGMTFPVFTLAVQNAVAYAQLGAATAATQFFRSIGGTLGAAVFGSLLTNRYAPLLHASLGPDVQRRVPPELLATFENPEALLNPQTGDVLRQGFERLGPQGPALLAEVLGAVRNALAVSIHEMFMLGSAIAVVALVAVLFLREIPLRRSHRPTDGAGEAGRELAATEVATDVPLLPARAEPEVARANRS
jgi:MFS family permease